MRQLGRGWKSAISYTTRRAAPGSEENGREYWFTNRAEFERMIAAGEFLEWAEVFGSNYYGTAMSALEHARNEAGTTRCWISQPHRARCR